MGRIRWAYLAAICSCWGWASLYPGSELALAEVEPFIIVWSRATVAGLALAALTCLRLGGVRAGLSRMRDELRAQPGKVLLLGTMAFVVTSSLSVSSEVFLPGSVAALLTGIGPLWIALGASALGHAARPWYLLGGSLLACVGVGAVALGQDAGGEGGAWWQLLATADWRGVILALTCSLAIAAAILVARRTVAGRDAVAITAVACCWAALALVPPGPHDRPRLPAPVRCQSLHPAHPRLPRPRQHRVQLCPLVLCAQSAARHPHRPLPISGGAAGGAVERTRLGRAADGEPSEWRCSPSSWVSSWRSGGVGIAVPQSRPLPRSATRRVPRQHRCSASMAPDRAAYVLGRKAGSFARWLVGSNDS